MKLEEFDNKVVTDLECPNRNFGIKNIDKVFSTLTTYVYKNPVRSVIGELSQNAFDSHIIAGKKDVPFDVHLPTDYEPYFSIRDYGVSMSDEFMMNGYTLLFNSTKSDSNESNGAWGIGRLTALALQDTYNVSCFKDGIQRDYIVYTENKVPKINKLQEQPTSEPDGVFVTINTGSDRAYEFIQNAEDIYSFYPVVPKFNRPINIDKHEFLIEEEKWAILQGSHNGSKALMGCYAYPIDIKLLGQISEKARSFLTKGVFLKFKIGDISINLSRDGLFYDKRTIDTINTALEELVQNYENKLKSEVSNINSRLKAAYKIINCSEQFSGLSLSLDWKGQTLFSGEDFRQNIFNFKLKYDEKSVRISKLGFYYSRRRYKYLPRLDECSLLPEIKFYRHYKIYLYINDLDKKANPKWRFTNLNHDGYSIYYVFDFEKDTDLDKFLLDNNLEKDDFTFLSTLPEIKPAKDEDDAEYARIKNDKHNIKNTHFKFNGTIGEKASDSWDILSPDEIDELEDTELPYVCLDRFTPYNTVKDKVPTLKILGYEGDIIGVKMKFFEKNQVSDKWTALDKFIEKLAENHTLDTEKIRKVYLRDFLQGSYLRSMFETKLIEHPDIDVKYIEECFKETTDNKFEVISRLKSRFDAEVQKIKKESQDEVSRIEKILNKKYKLFGSYFRYSYPNDEIKKNLKHYLKLENIAAKVKEKEEEEVS